MSQPVSLRTARDRLRYSLLFEAILMALIVPVGAAFFDETLTHIGLLMVMLSLNAMIWNLIYNWVFDLVEARQGRLSTKRTWRRRVLHAVGFEVLLTAMSLPINTYWLGISVLDAVSVNVIVTAFVVLYTYVFTFVYDLAFPLAQGAGGASGDAFS